MVLDDPWNVVPIVVCILWTVDVCNLSMEMDQTESVHDVCHGYRVNGSILKNVKNQHGDETNETDVVNIDRIVCVKEKRIDCETGSGTVMNDCGYDVETGVNRFDGIVVRTRNIWTGGGVCHKNCNVMLNILNVYAMETSKGCIDGESEPFEFVRRRWKRCDM